jgi:hypothetical protein
MRSRLNLQKNQLKQIDKMKRTPFLPICAALFLSVALGACDKEELQREPIALPATINLAGLGVTLSDQGFTADGFEFDAYRAQSQTDGVLLAYPTNNVASFIEVDLSRAEGLERISIDLFNNFDPEITYWNNGQLIGQVPLPIVYGDVVVVIDSLAGQPITSLRIASAETTVRAILLE